VASSADPSLETVYAAGAFSSLNKVRFYVIVLEENSTGVEPRYDSVWHKYRFDLNGGWIIKAINVYRESALADL
jgi:hypothetical protein